MLLVCSFIFAHIRCNAIGLNIDKNIIIIIETIACCMYNNLPISVFLSLKSYIYIYIYILYKLITVSLMLMTTSIRDYWYKLLCVFFIFIKVKF